MASGFREMQFAPDDPVGAGHFPGNPIVPGALLLDEVIRAIAGDAPLPPRCEVRSVKFLSPVKPGDRLGIKWVEDGGDIAFECALLDSQRVAVSGTLRLGGRSA